MWGGGDGLTCGVQEDRRLPRRCASQKNIEAHAPTSSDVGQRVGARFRKFSPSEDGARASALAYVERRKTCGRCLLRFQPGDDIGDILCLQAELFAAQHQ